MVEDRVTDGKRIGQLLASELTGREDGPLATVSVVDADRGAEPTPGGTVAYGVAIRGERVADVVLYPKRIEIALATDAPGTVEDRIRGNGLTSRGGSDAVHSSNLVDSTVVVRVEYGAAVKRAVDAMLAGFDE